jgi:protein involved in polysaccharide export with SLBB domain
VRTMNRLFRKQSFYVTILFCCFLAAEGFGQSTDQTPSAAPSGSSPASAQKPTRAGASDSNAALRQFVQSHPEVVEQLKLLLVERLRAEGSLIDEQSVSDEELYDRLQTDAAFRTEAVRWLVEQGYLSEDVAQTLIGQGEAPSGESRAQLGRPPSSESRAQLAREPGETGATELRGPTSKRPSERPPMGVLPPPYDDSALNPKTIPQDNPYPSLPSAKDLYTQFPEQPKNLRRFGSEIFRADVVGLRNFPMDLPAGPEYVLGPGDTVTVDIWGGVSQRLTRPVDREGRISLPDAGPVVVAGLTLIQAQKIVQSVLEPQFHNARVDLSVTRLRSVRVYVVGDVQRPGAYDISSLSTPLNALYAAGGPTPTGSLRIVKHYRGDQLVSEMDLYDLLIRGVRKSIEYLQPGDSILVPPVGPLVAVAGMVRRPAIYELKGETQLADVIDMAGGVSVSASLGEIKVERIEAHEKRVMVSVKMSPGADQQSLSKTIGPFRVQDGDRVWVAPILPYSDRSVYLQGHVYRPGTYPFKEGMKVTDLVHSYQEVLPEPANHAEIIRLQPPDFRPQTIAIDLPSALAGDETVTLQQFDTVRIFGRYEVDAPRVKIYGEVLRPGEFPMSSGMTAAALVEMAGGFRRSAYKEAATLASYVIENGTQVVTGEQSVKIGAAMAGDAASDVRLKPGDILTILQIPGWSEIGQHAAVNGEVMYPGSYGLTEGEHLSTLLKRVGGFSSAAYPQGAVLDRVEVRRLAEKGKQELIRRIEATTATVHVAPTSTGQDQAALLQAVQQQQLQTISRLRSQEVSGRLVINITGDISQWENTPADIQVRDGDVITVPKKPNFVVVNGQVYNPSAISWMPGKEAEWYLRQAGNTTEMALKKGIYIIRANGSVVSPGGVGAGWFKGSVLSTRMRPGDILVVPEKALGGSSAWKTTLETAQLLSSLAVAAAVAVRF